MRLPGLDAMRVSKRRRHLTIEAKPAVGRPQVVAHRGASALVAEHTLAAYAQALEDGAEALECDVRLTSDGHLVCVHDRRIDRTSSGRGALSALPLKELESLDWASWKHAEAVKDKSKDIAGQAGQHGGSHSILTLECLLDAVADWGRPVELAIETKHPTRYAGLVEQRLIELLDRYGWARPRRGHVAPVRVMSFSWLSLRRCLDMAPKLDMVYLMDRVPLRLRDGSLPLGVGVAGPSIEIIRAHPEYVDKVRAAGRHVHVWTVNDPRDIALCAALGVEAVITDRPRDALEQLSRSAPG